MWFLGGRVQTLQHDRFALVFGSQARLVKMVSVSQLCSFCSLLCGLMISIAVFVLQQCKVTGPNDSEEIDIKSEMVDQYL